MWRRAKSPVPVEKREIASSVELLQHLDERENRLYQGEILTAGGIITSYPAAERFRMLRAKIERANLKEDRYHVLAITSGAPAEGKSLVSVNLARALSIDPSGHTLLIDCDLRKPTVHRFFHFDQAPGLSDVLNNPAMLQHAVQPGGPRLDVLPAGTPIADPTELLERPDLPALLDQLRQQYKYVVLDCPPILLCSEMMALSTIVDGTILVARAWSTPRKLVAEALNMLGKPRVLGLVINDCVDATRHYLNYGYYGYHARDVEESSPKPGNAEDAAIATAAANSTSLRP